MRVQTTLIFCALVVASCSKSPKLDPTDPCNPAGAQAFGAEVPIQPFTPADGCSPSIISEYAPDGTFGKKLFTRRSEATLAQSYTCSEGAFAPSGVDFSAQGVTLVLWERRETESKKLIGIRDDGKQLLMIYEFAKCSTGDPNKFSMDSEAFVLPVKDRMVNVHRCPVTTDVCQSR